jgi:5-methyltetrahydrofolate--homocysteine methyltransferase
MAIEGLTIIGESINDSVPSTKKLFDAGDMDGILGLAKLQDERGAAYIDVNVGLRTPEFMADMVRQIQQVTTKPLCIDTPDAEIAAAGLEAYDQARAGGKRPILNSISPLRVEMFDLAATRAFTPIFLVTERDEGGQSRPCQTAEQTYQAARFLVETARGRIANFANGDCIIDPGIPPIASDLEGNLKRLIGAMEMIRQDNDLQGVHMSVGLSNLTVMLPSKRADGSPVKGPLESAFLTKAMPLGLDTVIGSVKRRYQTLAADHPAMVCLEDVLKADDFDAIMRVRDFYS